MRPQALEMAPLAPPLPADPAASDEHADDDERAGLLAAADGAVGQRRPSPGLSSPPLALRLA